MKQLPFVILLIITVILGIATFVEARYGAAFVQSHIYGSWWMLALWAALAVTALYRCCSLLYKQRKPALALHCSFAVILAGAALTFFTAERGQIHLRNDGAAPYSTLELPFTLRLDRFVTDYYTGTNTPADYISYLTVNDNGAERKAIVSMNNILRYKGFRFYQASYDQDGKGTILSISYDPYGIAVTYTGYLMLLVSMLWLLVSKHSGFRKLIRTLSCLALILTPLNAFGQRTLTKDEAKAFGQLSVSYHGRISPLDTYAKDFTLKICGKSSYKGFNSVQVLAGWLFFPDDWKEEQMIKIKDKEIRRLILGDKGGRARFSDFFSSGAFKLTYSNLPLQHKGMKETDEKMSLLMSLHSGGALRLFPHGNDWLSPADDLSAFSLSDDERLFVAKYLTLLGETLEQGKHDEALSLIAKLSAYQQKNAQSGSISPQRNCMEIFYNSFDAAAILFKINILIGLVAFFFFIRTLLTGRKMRYITVLAYIQIIHSLAFLTLTFALRWYISGHIPLSNGYETMIFVSLCIMLFTVLLARLKTNTPPTSIPQSPNPSISRKDFIPAIGLLLSGFTLLVASLGAMNPAITQLVPVLQSPWLSVHVSLIMISYALLGFIFFIGVTGVVVYFRVDKYTHSLATNNTNAPIPQSLNPSILQSKLQALSRILLYPALFTLAAGIFTGAVWANVSWGRYWGWDPKEVWALITMLVYSFAMHSQSLKVFRKPLFFHLFSIFAFLTVIMTYFGVSMFLGGMHSY
jgi:cytochrome c-type biogenesis protein CcsB